MKLQDQVCTIIQAKRLCELGVAQEGCYSWGCNDEFDNMEPAAWTLVSGTKWRHKRYSAFTLVELGAMIGKGTNAASLLYDAVQDQMNRSHSFTIVLSVQFVANCLIGMLETGRVTVEEVNARLCA